MLPVPHLIAPHCALGALRPSNKVLLSLRVTLLNYLASVASCLKTSVCHNLPHTHIISQSSYHSRPLLFRFSSSAFNVHFHSRQSFLYFICRYIIIYNYLVLKFFKNVVHTFDNHLFFQIRLRITIIYNNIFSK